MIAIVFYMYKKLNSVNVYYITMLRSVRYFATKSLFKDPTIQAQYDRLKVEHNAKLKAIADDMWDAYMAAMIRNPTPGKSVSRHLDSVIEPELPDIVDYLRQKDAYVEVEADSCLGDIVIEFKNTEMAKLAKLRKDDSSCQLL